MTTISIDFTQEDLERLQVVADYDQLQPYEYLVENIPEMIADELYLMNNRDFIEEIEKKLGIEE